jgi:hypothetical protein
MEKSYKSMKLIELQNIAESLGIETKTVSEKTSKKINKKKVVLIKEIENFDKNEGNLDYSKWRDTKIESIPLSKEEALTLKNRINTDWVLLSKLSKIIHDWDEYYQCSPNSWRTTPNYMIENEEYESLYDNYIEQYDTLDDAFQTYEFDNDLMLGQKINKNEKTDDDLSTKIQELDIKN